MGHGLTSFTADSMRGVTTRSTSDFQARRELVESNRDDVGAMLKRFAVERRTAERLRVRQSRRTTDARLRFVNRLRSVVKSMMAGFHRVRMEMASEIQAAGTVFRNRTGGSR